MNTFSCRWTISAQLIWSPRHRTVSILLTAPIIPQRRPRGDWKRSDEKAIEPMIQRPPASGRSPISGEVGRKFCDLIQDDGGTAIGIRRRNGRNDTRFFHETLTSSASSYHETAASSDVKRNTGEY